MPSCQYCGKELGVHVVGEKPFTHTVIDLCGCEKEAASLRLAGPEISLYSDDESRIANRIKRAGIPTRYRGKSCTSGKTREAIELSTQGNGLFISGPVGVGKTHLACFVLETLIYAGHTGRFIGSCEIFDQLHRAFDTKRDVMSELCKSDYLVIDDLGKEPQTNWTLSQLYSLIDRIWLYERPVLIVTSQYQASKLIKHFSQESDAEIAAAIVSRIAAITKKINLTGGDKRLESYLNEEQEQ